MTSDHATVNQLATAHTATLKEELGISTNPAAGLLTASKLASQLSNQSTTPTVSTYIANNLTEERSLKLLGLGYSQEAVASALGVSSSRISQLLSNSDFAAEVVRLRCATLHETTARDKHYDSLEDKLLAKLEASLPLLHKPDTILKAISTVNAAKRRGQAPEHNSNGTGAANIVNLLMPKVIMQQFVVNENNQVIKAGEQNLHTMSSGNLLKKVEAAAEEKSHVHTQSSSYLIS